MFEEQSVTVNHAHCKEVPKIEVKQKEGDN